MDAVFLYAKRNYLLIGYIAGIIIGITYFINLDSNYVSSLESYTVYYSDRFLTVNLWNRDLIYTVFSSHLKEFLLVFLVGYTSIKNPFNMMYCCFLGFCNCIYIYVATINYGLLGIILYISTIVPQCIITIPMTIFAIQKGGAVKTKKYIVLVMCGVLAICIIEALIEVFIGYKIFGIILKIVQK